MTGDFPAAHSMDTHWFAVDADGHVACFQTGETGALPLPGDTYYQAHYEYLEQLGAVVPSGEILEDVRGLAASGEHTSAIPSLEEPLLVLVDSLEPVREALDCGRAQQVATLWGFLVLFRDIDPVLRDHLHAQGVCKGCRPQQGWWYPGGGFEPARLGLFEYQSMEGLLCWGAPPYELGRRPATPVKVEQLPPAVREVAERIRLGFCFDEAPLLQPADHLECRASGGETYTSLDGTLRALPGSEQAVRELGEAAAKGYVTDASPWRALTRPPSPPVPRTRKR